MHGGAKVDVWDSLLVELCKFGMIARSNLLLTALTWTSTTTLTLKFASYLPGWGTCEFWMLCVGEFNDRSQQLWNTGSIR